VIRLLWGAFRARRAQTLTVLLLAMVAVTAAVAAPWYVLAAAEQAAVSDVTSAPADHRTFSASGEVVVGSGTAAGALDGLAATVRQALPVPDSRVYRGLLQLTNDTRKGSGLEVPVAYRDEVCAHVAITGRCPAAPGEALITSRTAGMFGVDVGGVISVRQATVAAPVVLRVVGRYDVADPRGDYWVGPLGPAANSGYGDRRADPVFVPLATFDQGRLGGPTAVADVVLAPAAFRQSEALAVELDRARYTLTQKGLQVSTSAGELLEPIRRDRLLIAIGVPVGAAQLLVLTWFALYLAGRYTVQDRRPDVALLKLRGASRGRLLRLVAGQSTVPILAGLVLGAGLGYLAGRLVGGDIQDPDWRRAAGLLSVGAVAVAVLGALLISMLAEWRTLRAPVVELLRRVPARRRTWRTDAVDLSVAAVAVASVYQLRSRSGALADVPGLDVLAPGLLELAAALLLARLLAYLSGRVSDWAVYHGRTRLGLGILQMLRRPGADRLFALLMVAVAMLGTAALSWDGARVARAARAQVELGAPRVLTVQATNRTRLLAAVRAADPTGRQAMAAVVNRSSVSGAVPTLAVDTERLAAVANWPAAVGTPGAALLAQLRAPSSPVLVSGPGLAVEASVTGAGKDPLWLAADLENTVTGERSRARFGPLGAAPRTYTADAGCTAAEPCRLVALALSGLPGAGAPPPPATTPVASAGGGSDAVKPPPPFPAEATVTVTRLGQRGPDRTVLSAADLADPRRFRTGTGVGSGIAPTALSVSTGTGGLLLATDASRAGLTDQRAFVCDAPVPVPAVRAGDVSGWGYGDPTFAPFGGERIPVRVVGTAPVLPGLGTGVLVDLASTQRAVTDAGVGDVMQVWLASGAPAGVLDRLRAAGLSIVDDRSARAARARLDRQGTAAALRFQLLTALVGIVLATAALTVAGAVERVPRAADLAALRVQGLPARVATATGYGGYAALVGLAVLAGLGAAALAATVTTGLPVFSDGWHDLPTGTGPHLSPLGWAALAAVPLALAATVVSRLMLGQVRR
jgi:hypothetical protein